MLAQIRNPSSVRIAVSSPSSSSSMLCVFFSSAGLLKCSNIANGIVAKLMRIYYYARNRTLASFFKFYSVSSIKHIQIPTKHTTDEGCTYTRTEPTITQLLWHRMEEHYQSIMRNCLRYTLSTSILCFIKWREKNHENNKVPLWFKGVIHSQPICDQMLQSQSNITDLLRCCFFFYYFVKCRTHNH